MLHNYYAVCFEEVIQALDTLLNLYIMNSWPKRCCSKALQQEITEKSGNLMEVTANTGTNGGY